MPYGKTVYTRDIQWSDPLVAVFVVVPRFVVSLVSSLSSSLGGEVNLISTPPTPLYDVHRRGFLFCLLPVVDGLQRLPQSQSDESAVFPFTL